MQPDGPTWLRLVQFEPRKREEARSQFHQHFTNSFFVQKSFEQLFLYLQVRFGFFWQKEIDAKAAHKMLVKLIPGSYDG